MSGRKLRQIPKALLRIALARELSHAVMSMSMTDLADGPQLQRTARHMARGMGREDVLMMLLHATMLTRIFAAEVPVARRDQILAALDELDGELDVRWDAAGPSARSCGP